MIIFQMVLKGAGILQRWCNDNFIKTHEKHNTEESTSESTSYSSNQTQQTLLNFVNIAKPVDVSIKQKLDDAAINCIILDGRPFMDFEKNGKIYLRK